MQAEITYNWDDIEVGRFDLNHSEDFFSQKHQKHECFLKNFNLIPAMDAINLNEIGTQTPVKNSHDKENANPSIKKHITKSIDSLPAIRKANSLISPQSKSVNKSLLTVTNVDSNRRPANLLTRLKTPEAQAKSAGSAPVACKTKKPLTKADPPHVYEFMDIYQKKKEEKLKKVLEEEKKNRIFHSRPVPRSVSTPRDMTVQKVPQSQKVTAVKTPLVLKHSRDADERRRERLEEWKRNNVVSKFASREAVVLLKEPFKPKKSLRTITAQPFTSNVEKRLEERKHFDEQHRRNMEEKKKQEEEDRKKREDELNKEVRKLANFKARPNPFK